MAQAFLVLKEIKTQQFTKVVNLSESPSPCIMADGIGGTSRSQYWIEINEFGEMNMTNSEKPPYSIPTMDQINAIPWNGYKVVSSFTGAGGSCLGYRMAGFRVLWASEFIPAAQEVYRLNHPTSILDTRDIREVQPEEILEAVGLDKGDLDIFDGSPPCASFSMSGKREESWGEVKKYSDTKQRVDDLFFEYARLLNGLQPKVFVAENVSGLVKGKAKGYFKLILKEFKKCGYNVKAKMLDAQWLGVPQTRQRIIFIGVRNDLALEPSYPKPLPYRYSVRDAIPWIVSIRHGKGFGDEQWVDSSQAVAQTIGAQPSSGNNFNNGAHKVQAIRAIHDTKGQPQYSQGDITDRPSPTVTQSGSGQWFIEQQVVEPETDIDGYAIGREWERLEPGEKGQYHNFIKARLDQPSPTITQAGGHQGTASVAHPTEKRKFSIAELKRICSFPDDFKLTGSYDRQWERLGRAVPPIMMAAVAQRIKEDILDKCVG